MLDETCSQYPYHTMSALPTGYTCRQFWIPDDVEWRAAIYGVLSILASEDYVEKAEGGIEVWQQANEILSLITSDTSCGGTTPEGVMLPVGSIITWPGLVVPANMLLCDGTQYNRVDYPDLYAVLNSAFIVSGDLFVVPDLNERFVQGCDDGDIGEAGGSATKTLDITNMPAHSHTFQRASLSGTGNLAGRGTNTFLNDMTTSIEGGSQPFYHLPPYLKLEYLIVALADT